jgi:hypothetical protein
LQGSRHEFTFNKHHKEKPEGDETQEPSLKVIPKFSQSGWYKDIIFYLQNLSFPPTWEKDKAIYIKLKAMKYFILGENLFWKDPRRNFVKFPH